MARVPLQRGGGRVPGQLLGEAELLLGVGDGLVMLKNRLRVHADLLRHILRVDVYAEIALHRPLCHGLGRELDAGDLLAALGDRVHVGGGAAHVKHHQVAHLLVQQTGAFHHRAGGRDDGAGDQLPHLLHAGSVDDMLLEHLMDDLAGGLDVELVQAGIDVFGDVELGVGILEDPLDPRLVLHVPGVDHGDAEVQLPDALGVFQSGLPLAEIGASGDENEVGIDVPQVLQILVLHDPRRHQMQVGACAQRGLAGGPDGHVIDQPVHRHPQTSGGAGGGQHGVVFQIAPAVFPAKVVHGAPQAHAYISLQHGGGRLALSQKERFSFAQMMEGIDHGGGGADLGNQNVKFHNSSSITISSGGGGNRRPLCVV